MALGGGTGSRAAVLPLPQPQPQPQPRDDDVEMGEMGLLAGALYDEQAWAAGERLRQTGEGFAEEDYVPAKLARQRLQTVVADMDAMRSCSDSFSPVALSRIHCCRAADAER
jgi:hypothetical protein